MRAILPVAMIVGALAWASPLVGQGCPWCTTPTTCSTVNEDAAAWCGIVASGTCTYSGSCEYQGPPEGFLLEALGTDASRLVHVETELGAVVLTPVAGGRRFAAWGCTGTLTLLFERRMDGTLHRLDPNPYRDQYSLWALVGWPTAHGTRPLTIMGSL